MWLNLEQQTNMLSLLVYRINYDFKFCLGLVFLSWVIYGYFTFTCYIWPNLSNILTYQTISGIWKVCDDFICTFKENILKGGFFHSRLAIFVFDTYLNILGKLQFYPDEYVKISF